MWLFCGLFTGETLSRSNIFCIIELLNSIHESSLSQYPLLKFIKKHLLAQVIIAIVLGIILGNYLPESLSRIFATFNSLFDNFLEFIIPLIIVGLIVPAIGNIGKTAGKLLLFTVLIAYGSTYLSGLMSYGISIETFPRLLGSEEVIHIGDGQDLQPYFEIEMPPVIDVMSGLLFAFIVGIALSLFKMPYLQHTFDEFKEIIMWVIRKLIVPFLPLFIFGIFLNMTYNGQVYLILKTFLKIIGVIFAMHILLLVTQYVVAGSIAKRNPFKMMRTMIPAYFTALGTQSSAATIPVTLKQAKKNKVNPKIAGFTIPLCATIHLSGSTLKIVACAIALMLIQGIDIQPLQMFGFIAMLGITMVAAPGVPGGAIMAALGVLSSVLGFGEEEKSLMIALYIAMDSFGTAANIFGDGAIAVVIDKINARREKKAAVSS